jgi:2Fe-2S ferredoxin
VPHVTYVLFDGSEHRIEVPAGKSVMRGAIDNKIRGIEAICGGECACGTCHVYIEAPFLDLVPPLSEDEDAMLGCVAAERRANSRLSCQIVMTPALEGLRVHMPLTQSLE